MIYMIPWFTNDKINSPMDYITLIDLIRINVISIIHNQDVAIAIFV